MLMLASCQMLTGSEIACTNLAMKKLGGC